VGWLQFFTQTVDNSWKKDSTKFDLHMGGKESGHTSAAGE